tara:strand:+ start:2420 stop:2542 length:123 start_codon:yes stop_codon:yes gene_type:complete
MRDYWILSHAGENLGHIGCNFDWLNHVGHNYGKIGTFNHN